MYACSAASDRERIHGCLLGGAVGDAMGAPVEFLSRAEILGRFGCDGITGYAPAYGGLGRITDDTQMTLFTAEGLIRAFVRGRLRGIVNVDAMVACAYLRWLLTQGMRPQHDVYYSEHNLGWLYAQTDLHARRAPGNTCLAALTAMRSIGEPARNSSKGCGGVMRVAPVGLYAACVDGKSSDAVFDVAAKAAALTHGHPTGWLTAGFLAVLVYRLMAGASLPEGIAAAKGCLGKHASHEETLTAVERAEAHASSGMPASDAIAQLGEGWVAEEALAIALYCALVARDFREGILLAINHDGDSDSTGSIAGNILGTMLGVQAIPRDWLDPLELGDVICELADDLCSLSNRAAAGDCGDVECAERLSRKYPGC